MKRTFINVVLIAACVLLLSLSFTACKKDDATADNELTVWAGGQWTGTDLQNLKSFISEYNETNKLGLTVNVVAKSDMETSLATAVRTNKVPDILIWDRFNTPTYSETDALLDVTSYIERDAIDTSVFNDEAMSELYYNGKCYGLPLDLDVWGLYVNTDMVDEYNANNPSSPIVLNDDWTWDDLYNIAKKLTVIEDNSMKVAGYSGHVMHQHYFKYMCSTSQDFLNAEGKPNFDTAQSKKILEFFKKVGGAGNGIWENGLCEKSNFAVGQLAIIDQSLYFTDYIELYSKGELNYKFMPQPRYVATGDEAEGVNGGMLGGFGIAFPKPASKFLTDDFYAKFEIAWSFAKDWLLSETLQTKWSQTTGTLPALKALYTSEAVLNNETLRRAASFVPNYRIRPQIPGYLAVQTQAIDVNIKAYTEGTATLDATVAALINGYEVYSD